MSLILCPVGDKAQSRQLLPISSPEVPGTICIVTLTWASLSLLDEPGQFVSLTNSHLVHSVTVRLFEEYTNDKLTTQKHLTAPNIIGGASSFIEGTVVIRVF